MFDGRANGTAAPQTGIDVRAAWCVVKRSGCAAPANLAGIVRTDARRKGQLREHLEPFRTWTCPLFLRPCGKRGHNATCPRQAWAWHRLSAYYTATVDRGGKGCAGHRWAVVSRMRYDRRRISLGGRPWTLHRAPASSAGAGDKSCTVGSGFAGNHAFGRYSGSNQCDRQGNQRDSRCVPAFRWPAVGAYCLRTSACQAGVMDVNHMDADKALCCDTICCLHCRKRELDACWRE